MKVGWRSTRPRSTFLRMAPPLRELTEYLRELGAELVVLFGSRAAERHREDSDWDVGVLLPRGADLLRVTAEVGRIVGGRVDLVDLRRASPLLGMSVVREGKVLLDPTGIAFPQFASLTLRRYSDTAKLREAQRESLERFTTGDGKP